MQNDAPTRRTRRAFLRAACAMPALFGVALSGRYRASAQVHGLPPTPACTDHDEVTPAQTEGPYYKRNSPQRTSFLEPGITGTPMVVTGTILTTDCQPLARALVDFWHADAQGVYDNVGSRLRGHQFTDEAGHYALQTIVPGRYPGRTRHFHVKVQAPNQPVLTTQLYFPAEPYNATDGFFNPQLLMTVQDTADGKVARFNFVVASPPRKTRARSEQL